VEVSSLCVTPSEAILMYGHEVMHQRMLTWPKEITWVRFIDNIFSF